MARVATLLSGARDGAGGVLVVSGEPGIGKSLLLAAAADSASGFLHLSCRGVEGEAALGYAALLEALTPLRDAVAGTPSAQATALAAALGWAARADVHADAFLIGAATMSLLATAAERAPVLVTVDDYQWLDAESARSLLFAARRLTRDAVVFLVALRGDAYAYESLRGLPDLALGGLAPTVAGGLLPAGTTRTVVDGLVERTAGNPLALMESAARLSPAQCIGAAPLPDPLPVGNRLELAYESLLAGLSPDAWRLALLCALNVHSAPVPVALGLDPARGTAAWDEAEERGVIVQAESGPQFRHPLIRAAVLRRAAPAERRSAHRALADTLAGAASRPARVWHLAAATTSIDDSLAEELVEIAADSRDRSGLTAASSMLERAARLTSNPTLACERLAAAAADALQSGDVVHTRRLAAEVLSGPATPAARAQVLFALGTLEHYAGSLPAAVDMLQAAADAAEPPDRVRILGELTLARFRLGDLPGIAECARQVAQSADESDAEQRLLDRLLRGIAAMLTGDAEAAQALLVDVIRLAGSAPLQDDPRNLLYLAMAAGFLGDVREAIVAGAPLLAKARERGAIGVLVPSLALLATAHAWLGDHNAAFAAAGEAAELGERFGYVADVATAVAMLAWQSASRGLHDDARRALDKARALTDRAGTTTVGAHQAITAAYCALCRGDLDEVASTLRARIAADSGVGAAGEPLGVAPLLVEALVGLGRIAEADDLTDRYVAATPRTAPARTRALVERCRALVTPGDGDPEAAFAAALEQHSRTGDPFEEARTRLLYGARLRRAGQRIAAREQLRAASAAFETMGLTLWVRRAADELAATGATARRRATSDSEPLTSQETRVALLVAEGLSNRAVATALFLSPRTVEHHLASIYRKRGFRGRIDLVRAYATNAFDPRRED